MTTAPPTRELPQVITAEWLRGISYYPTCHGLNAFARAFPHGTPLTAKGVAWAKRRGPEWAHWAAWLVWLLDKSVMRFPPDPGCECEHCEEKRAAAWAWLEREAERREKRQRRSNVGAQQATR